MDILTALATCIGLVGAAGGAVGYFGKARGDTIIAYQEKALKLRDDDIARLQRENEGLLKENMTLREQNKILQGLVEKDRLGDVTLAIEQLNQSVQKSLRRGK